MKNRFVFKGFIVIEVRCFFFKLWVVFYSRYLKLIKWVKISIVFNIYIFKRIEERVFVEFLI